MSDEALPIAKCPNPECGAECKAVYSNFNDADNSTVCCYKCGYQGPAVKWRKEAIRLHNLIARPSVSTAELEKLANRIGTDATVNGYAKDAQEVLRTFRDDLRALISKATNGRGNQ